MNSHGGGAKVPHSHAKNIEGDSCSFTGEFLSLTMDTSSNRKQHTHADTWLSLVNRFAPPGTCRCRSLSRSVFSFPAESRQKVRASWLAKNILRRRTLANSSDNVSTVFSRRPGVRCGKRSSLEDACADEGRAEGSQGQTWQRLPVLVFHPARRFLSTSPHRDCREHASQKITSFAVMWLWWLGKFRSPVRVVKIVPRQCQARASPSQSKRKTSTHVY